MPRDEQISLVAAASSPSREVDAVTPPPPTPWCGVIGHRPWHVVFPGQPHPILGHRLIVCRLLRTHFGPHFLASCEWWQVSFLRRAATSALRLNVSFGESIESHRSWLGPVRTSHVCGGDRMERS